MRRLSLLLATAVMALTLIAVAAGVSAAAPNQQQPQPNHFYGAMYLGDTGVWWETGTSKASAVQAATASCEAKDTNCVLSVWVNNGWAVYTEGKVSGGFESWSSWGKTEQEASADGLKACQDSGATNCQTRFTFQTAIDPNKPTTGGFE
jgi:Domain of unknown function (DUF4189)